MCTLNNTTFKISNPKVPKSLSDMCLLSIHLQPSQNSYYLFKNGLLTDSIKALKFKNAKSSDYAGVYLQESVNILTGKDNSGEKVIIIDSDNNNDFTNDKIFQ